jgi:predicted metal-dependent phosphoesterase TrpH
VTFPLNPDLHSHSTVSDGMLAPEQLAARARTNGVDLWALTDHDEISGQARARAAAREQGIGYLTGVEISVTFADVTVHIVGLGFNADDAQLTAGLAATRNGRDARARAISQRLQELGISGAYEGALRYAGNPALIGRAHFARHLVETGVCRDATEVFRKYLADGKPAYVPHQWAKLGDAVRWITRAGGTAVIAHPARYNFTPAAEDALFTEFKTHGGQGVEVVTGSHTAAEARLYAGMAREFDLAASRGSDFHAPKESPCDLGQLAPLPPDLTPVWALLTGRIQ